MVSRVKPPTSASSTDLVRAHVERARLGALAYRLLGTISDAEDAVQETYLRWYRLTREEREQVRAPMAWHTKTLSRICLDQLRSARTRREVYVGEWLPEPVPDAEIWAINSLSPPMAERADPLSLAHSVSMALMIVLDKMTPAERVSFILHDVFQYSFAEIGEIVGRTPHACRQLASSARKRIGPADQVRVSRTEHQRVNAAFKAAWTSGDISDLVEVLETQARAVTDGGGRVSAAIEPIHGAEAIAEFFLSVLERQPNLQIHEALVNGEPGLVGKAARQTVAVISTCLRNGRISEIWAMRNPDKLRVWQ